EENAPPIIALDDINLEIEEGTFTAILGMNGSGKSTLAKNMNALYVPSSGIMFVDGMDTRQDELVWEIRKTAGMVFQNPDNQLVSAVVEDDVAFGPENIGVPTEEIRQRVDEAMKAAGIYEQRFKSPSQLSGGQKQRVAIAGVLALKPRCIVFDEPTAMLDPQGRSEVMEIIRKLRAEKITVVLITHFMEEAADADRIIVMKNGKIISDGTPAEIFACSEVIDEAGLDIPAAVRIKNMLLEKGVDIPADILHINTLAEYICSIAGGGTDAR
ncbi:MAG: energy-coupling factor transporter ATPase, partial [Firmicutes bacterium]|nr:energy-coupling factor transporter ATPase [Bacillota bacterium]